MKMQLLDHGASGKWEILNAIKNILKNRSNKKEISIDMLKNLHFIN